MIRDRKFTTINTRNIAIIIIIAIGIIVTTLIVTISASTTVRAQQGNPTEQQSVDLRIQNTSMSVPGANCKVK